MAKSPLIHIISILLSLSFSYIETYELIRTCDPAVACWSDDGETFIVKDPTQFETVVIPQFFKHNKFTSFVRVSVSFALFSLVALVVWFCFVGIKQRIKFC
jgi:HSF-type DNA-binding